MRYKGGDGGEEGLRVSRTWLCVGSIGLLLSLGAICNQGSDIGVMPVYKNEKRRAQGWMKETRLADVERQRKDVVVMERAMQRSPRGILIRRFLAAWLHPRRIHPHLASC